jgi:hypothetical protein
VNEANILEQERQGWVSDISENNKDLFLILLSKG